MATVINIGGSTLNVPHEGVAGRLVAYSKGAPATFDFAVRGGKFPVLPNPYTGKAVTVTINGTLRFSGEVVSGPVIHWANGIGWTHDYQCMDLRYLADKVPHTDRIDGGDQSVYNTSRDNDPMRWLAARAGRTVGQVLTDVLTGQNNAQALTGYGVGNYTGLPSAPALPAATVADLAALNWIPPGPCPIGGEKLFSALVSFCAQWAPTHVPHVEPDGTIRFLDLRAFSPLTLTYNSDPILISELSRDTADCASRVVVRGQGIAEMILFSTTNNGLSEAPFAHDGLTVAQAKADWTPDDFRTPGLHVGAPGDDEGTCTCGDTLHVTVTSANAAVNWPANYWDQTSTGHLGTVFLSWSAGVDITTYVSRSIVSNTALAAAGTSVLTLDRALPHTNFDHYTITGQIGGASAVWCVYQLPAWAAEKVAFQSTYPFAYRQANGASDTLTSTAMGSVLWSTSGAPPYNFITIGIQVDPVTGYVHFPYPTYLTAGGRAPDEVRALVPIYTGTNQVVSPADVAGVPQYAGTYKAIEGKERTLTVTVPSWRDPLNASSMQAYADNLLDSVKNTILEGTVEYLGLYESALDMGHALNVAGAVCIGTTGWEAASIAPIPIVSCSVAWNCTPGAPTSWTTSLHCSNRMAHFSAEMYMKPDRTGVSFDWEGLPNLLPMALANRQDYSGLFDQGPSSVMLPDVFGPMQNGATPTRSGRGKSGTVVGDIGTGGAGDLFSPGEDIA